MATLVNLGQHKLRSWLVAWWHQAITWTNVDLSSVRSSGIHLSAILQEIPQPSVTEISLTIIYLKFCSNLPGANDFGTCYFYPYPSVLDNGIHPKQYTLYKSHELNIKNCDITKTQHSRPICIFYGICCMATYTGHLLIQVIFGDVDFFTVSHTSPM